MDKIASFIYITPHKNIAVQDNNESWESTRKLLIQLFFRFVNYTAVYVYIFALYTFGLLGEQLLFGIIAWTLQDTVQTYPIVTKGFQFLEIGLAYATIILGIVHFGYQLIGQVRQVRQHQEELDAQLGNV